MHPSTVILLALALYAAPSIVFAGMFVWCGAGAIDPVGSKY